ncbi:MAG: hypothetical protein WCI29_05450 [Actinomycetes bacterium]
MSAVALVLHGLARATSASASPSPSPSAGTPPDAALVTPGILGFISLAFLGIAVVVIWRSMNKQLKRIDFDESATASQMGRKKKAPKSTSDPVLDSTPPAAESTGDPVID